MSNANDFDRLTAKVNRIINDIPPTYSDYEISERTRSIAEAAIGVLPDDYELSGLPDDAIMRDALFLAGAYDAAFGKSGETLRSVYFQTMSGSARRSVQSADNGRAEYRERMSNAWKRQG